MLESRIGFEVEGMEFNVREDVAAGVMDFRDVYMNAGA